MIDRELWQKKERLIELARGYRASRVLITAFNLGLFQHLSEGPQTLEEIGFRLYLPERSLGRLLEACRALGLVERVDQRSYANSQLAHLFLEEDQPLYIGHALRLEDHFFHRWLKLDETIMSGGSLSRYEQQSEYKDWTRLFILGMHELAQGPAEALADRLDLAGRGRLCDVGAGSGAFSIALVRKNPGLHAFLFDLPPVLEVSAKIVADSGLANRIILQPGDYHRDEFVPESDVVLFSGILLSESEKSCQRLLRKAYRSLLPSGLVVIRDFMLDERGGPLEATLFSLQMLMETEAGACHREHEVTYWVREAGFEVSTIERMPMLERSTLIVGRKP